MKPIVTREAVSVLAVLALLLATLVAARSFGRPDRSWQILPGDAAPSRTTGLAAERNDPRLGNSRWYGPASCLVSADANCECQADLGDVVLVASAWRCQSGD
jgi:hypothetical protein